MVALKVNEKELYVKGIDDKTDKLVFTETPRKLKTGMMIGELELVSSS